MKSLRILIVTEYYPPHIGGVETFFYELRKELLALGHHVDVITTSQPDAPAREKDEGGEVIRVKVPRAGDRYFFSMLAIPEVLKKARKADVIHCTTYNSIPPAWLASKIGRKPAILSVHEVLGPRWHSVMPKARLKANIFRFIEWSLLQFSFTHSVAVSKFTQDDLPARMKRHSSVIHHGIDPMFKASKKKPSHPGLSKESALLQGGVGPSTFLFFGRSAPQKGFWFLLESLPKFFEDPSAQKNARFVLMLSASREELKRVDDFLVKKGLEKYVTLKAPVKREDLPAVLQSASAVVVPSFSEGFGFAAAEAAACRVPLVVSDAGSLPEVVSGRHIFFKSGSRASLLKALHRALHNKWSYKKPISFTWEKAAHAFEALYRRLAK